MQNNEVKTNPKNPQIPSASEILALSRAREQQAMEDRKASLQARLNGRVAAIREDLSTRIPGAVNQDLDHAAYYENTEGPENNLRWVQSHAFEQVRRELVDAGYRVCVIHETYDGECYEAEDRICLRIEWGE